MNPRDYTNFINNYLSLLEDIYPQPIDDLHAKWAKEVINKWIPILPFVKTILDVGCGQAFVQPMFEEFEVQYLGITLGNDTNIANEMGRNTIEMDYNFMTFDDNSFDLLFSRHSLEHSPFPLLTLMEWHRVTRKYLILALPTPEGWGWAGRNHYSVMHLDQLKFLLGRANFGILKEDYTEMHEYRLLCEKIK